MHQLPSRMSHDSASLLQISYIPLAIGFTIFSWGAGCNYEASHANDDIPPASDVQISVPSSPDDRLALLQQHYMQRLAGSSSGTVSGQVLDLNDAPISGVSVKLGTQITTTDASGRYTLTEVPVGTDLITFEHAQYVLTQRPVTVMVAVDPRVDVNLLPRSKAQHFDADKGASLSEGPLTLSFAPNDLAFLDGSVVHGQIDIVMTVIDPRKPEHITAAPARLEGIDLNGNQVGLFSYGMAEIEVFQGTKQVQVRSGRSVKALMNIEGLERPKDDAIPMWHHDTTLGVWVQEPNVETPDQKTFGGVSRIGTAFVQRDAAGALVAVTQLPHFSSWNWDFVQGATCTSVTVPAGTAVSGFRVVSTTETGALDNIWTVNAQCYGNTPLGSRCTAVSPSASFGSETYFKYQALVGTTWCDVAVALYTDPTMPPGTGKTILQGKDVNAWLMQTGQTTAASWCGTALPGGVITGAWNVGNVSPLPTPRIPIIVTSGLGSCGSLIGGDAAAGRGDSGFRAMIANSLSSSAADADRDGVIDALDKCASNSGPQSDSNNNGIGDTCEGACYIPLTDPLSTIFDFDQDGIDDVCDNRPTVFNPSQYVPTF